MFINKYIFICIVLLLPLNYAFSETITEMAVSSSYIEQFNLRTSLTVIKGNRFYRGIEAFSVSSVKQDNIYYISSNGIASIMALSGFMLEDGKKHLYDIIFIVVPAVWLANLKVGYKINKNIFLSAGQNTDFYPFYRMSRICSQSNFGVKVSYKSFLLNSNICIPWNKGYYNTKEPYVSMGLGYNIAGNNDD